MFKTRTLFPNNTDAEIANQWLEGWKYNPLPVEMYPDKGLVLLDSKENAVYVGFVWTSNSGLAQLGFITRNPFNKTKLPKNIRKEFLQSLKDYAISLGYPYVITWTENKFLVDDFKELGFRETSNKCSELINYSL